MNLRNDSRVSSSVGFVSEPIFGRYIGAGRFAGKLSSVAVYGCRLASVFPGWPYRCDNWYQATDASSSRGPTSDNAIGYCGRLAAGPLASVGWNAAHAPALTTASVSIKNFPIEERANILFASNFLIVV